MKYQMITAIDFTWDQHIFEFTSKAIGTVEILRPDLSFALRQKKAAAYEILIKPILVILEYIICLISSSLNSDLAG